jgi:type VI secretion system secreted protein Hcp
MAYEFYVTITGSTQGKLKGDSTRKGQGDGLRGFGLSYSVLSPRDAASGLPTGRRQHGPVTFLKPWGAGSVQLFQVLYTNEVLTSVLFEFVETTRDGVERVTDTIRLANATVTGLRRYVDRAQPAGADSPPADEVELVFQRIELEHGAERITASDDWTATR